MAIEKLEELHWELSKIPVVNVKDPSWTGLVGAVQQYKADSKFENLCNIPIMDTNYINVPGMLIQLSEDSKNSDISKIDKAYKLVVDCYDLWKSRCPGIDNCLIDDSIGKGKSLPIGVVTKYYVNKTFLSYNLSEELRSEVNQDLEYQKWRIKRLTEASDNSGSSFNMSVLVWVIVTLLCLLGLAFI